MSPSSDRGRVRGLVFSGPSHLRWAQAKSQRLHMRHLSTVALCPHVTIINTLRTYLLVTLKLESKYSLVALSECLPFCPYTWLPHSPFSRRTVVRICRVHGKFPNICEPRTTLSTLLFSYGGTISQMVKLFKMKENPKRILIFSRAVIVNVPFQTGEGTHLEGTQKSKTICMQ